MRFRLTTLVVILNFFFFSESFTQTCEFPPLDGLDCSTAKQFCGHQLDGYQSTLPTDNVGSNPNQQLCINSENDGGMVNNVEWISFYACESTVSIDIIPANCTVENSLTGIQAGIYADCSFTENVICVIDCFTESTTLESNDFVPGQRYFLMIDGCNGSVCDYTIEVNEGIDLTIPELQIDPISDGEVTGPLIACTSDIASFGFEAPVCEITGDSGCPNDGFGDEFICYQWTIPESAEFVGDPNGPEIEVIFTEPGSFDISVELILHPDLDGCGIAMGECGDILPLQINVSQPNYTVLDTVWLCPGESYFFCGQQHTIETDVICPNAVDPCLGQVLPIRFIETKIVDFGEIMLCEDECFNFKNTDYCNEGDFEIPVNTCDSLYIFTIRQIDISTDLAGLDELNCTNLEINLNAQTINNSGASITYVWRNSEDNVIGNDPILSISTPGNYSVETRAFQNGKNCEERDLFEIEENVELPEFDLSAPDIDCLNDQVEIELTPNSDIQSYAWTGPSNFQSSFQSPTVSAVGVYEVVATGSNGCEFVKQIEIFEDESLPEADYDLPMLSCLNPEGQILVESEDDILTYIWILPDNSTILGQDPMVDQVGNYELQVEGVNGCVNTYNFDLDGDFEEPEISVNEEVIDCDNPVASTSVSSNMTIVSLEWNGPDAFVSDEAMVELTVAGTYTVEVWAPNGCSTIEEFEILDQSELPQIDIDDAFLWKCNSMMESIFASSNDPNYDFDWTTSNGIIISGANSLECVIDGPGMYYLEALNPNTGCKSIDSVEILINPDVPISAEILTEDPICFGDDSGIIEILSIEGGEGPYEVWLNDLDQNGSLNISNLNTGYYSLDLIDANGCELNYTIEILSPEEYIIDMQDIYVHEYGSLFSLLANHTMDPNSVLEVEWLSANLGLLSNDLLLEYEPESSDSLRLTIIDINGCQIQKWIQIEVRKSNDVYIPNAFSPNGDGINDHFAVFGRADIGTVKTLNIFDRWGNLVFQKTNFDLNDEEAGWDGRMNQKQAPSGVYVYAIEINLADGTGTDIYQGSINLIR